MDVFSAQKSARTRRGASIFGISALLAVMLSACAPSPMPPPDQGKLRLQTACSTDTLSPAGAEAWFQSAGFSSVQLSATPIGSPSLVSQLSRGQVMVGIMPLSAVAEAIESQAEPLVIVAVLPSGESQNIAFDCVLNTDGQEPEIAEPESPESTESPAVSPSERLAADPWVIVTTRDVLLDSPLALQAFLAAEARIWASRLGAAELDGKDSTSNNSDEVALDVPATHPLSALSEASNVLGHPLSESRLIDPKPLELALKLAPTLFLPTP
ncbi:MAG: hypothetical protein WBA28_02980 [Microbacteriaceae bacterium]